MAYNGAIQDPRPYDEKERDWTHEEITGSGTYVWTEKQIPNYTKRNQNGSSECGAFSGVKALGINNLKENGTYVDLDPHFIYEKRINKTSDGMYLQDLLKIMCTYGAPKDIELNCDNKAQATLNAMTYTPEEVKEALTFRGKNYVTTTAKSIDEIARIIDMGYTPIGLLRCGLKEWTTEPKTIPGVGEFDVNHFVPFTCATLRNGKKTLVVDDSWGSSFGQNGMRFIDEDFLKERFVVFGYVIDLSNSELNSDKHKFNTVMYYGMMNNPEVRFLQDRLKKEGIMNKDIPSTGNYLSITADAVWKYQVVNNVAPLNELNGLKGKLSRVGPKTLEFLNK